MSVIVKKDDYIQDLPGNVVANIERILNRDDAWKKMAESCSNEYGECVFSMVDIRDMERSGSPARALLNKFIKFGLQVDAFQDLCLSEELNLIEIHELLVTNTPMQIIYPKENEDMVCKSGESIKFSVQVCGSPLPTCQWFHNNQIIHGQTSHILIIDNVGVQDEGVYYCLLRQTLKGECAQVSEGHTGSFNLSLQRTPPIIIKDLPEELSVLFHDNLKLEFNVKAHTNPEKYIWYKDNKEIKQSRESQLMLSEVDALTEGIYHCEVRNDEGSCVTRRTRVEVLGSAVSPTIPKKLEEPTANAVYYVNDWVHLKFTVSCCLQVKFTCFLNNEIITDNGQEIIIKQHSPDRNNPSNSEDEHTCNLSYEISEDNMDKLDWKLKFSFEAVSSKGRIFSSDVPIKVKEIHGKKTYTARNKWAFLVGIVDYTYMNKLKTPYYDTKVLAKELEKLDFNVIMLNDLTKEQFQNSLRNFSEKFVQKNDYVVFYFAGHGVNIKKYDYMLPVDAELSLRNRDSLPEIMHSKNFIDVNMVTEYLQKRNPALILFIYDMCRHLFKDSTTSSRNMFEESHIVEAKANSYYIYATSMNYDAFEATFGTSCLIHKLKNIIGNKVSVEELGQNFRKLFQNMQQDCHMKQVPRTESDLAEPRSLTDIARPRQKDRTEGGVLSRWKKLFSVGMSKESEVRVGGATLRISVSCRHRNTENTAPIHTLSNKMLLVIEISRLEEQCNQPSNQSSNQSSGPIQPSTEAHGQSDNGITRLNPLSNVPPVLEFIVKLIIVGQEKINASLELRGRSKKEEYRFNIYQNSLVVNITSKDDKSVNKMFELETPLISSIFEKPPPSTVATTSKREVK